MQPDPEAKSAWLVTWEGTSDIPPDPVVAILNYRTSAASVKELVEQMYAALSYTPREKLLCAKNRKNNPYPATMSVFQNISCGDNPWLYARLVTDIKVIDGKPNWKEPASDPERTKKLSSHGEQT